MYQSGGYNPKVRLVVPVNDILWFPIVLRLKSIVSHEAGMSGGNNHKPQMSLFLASC